MFEPFIVDCEWRAAAVVPGPWDESRLRRGVSRYVPPDATADPWAAAIERVLAGDVLRTWHDDTRPGIYRRRVVKTVRGNLLLGHVTARWPELGVIWLVRDPLEVVASQLRMGEAGWDFGWSPEHALDQAPLMRDWLSPFQDLLRGAETPEETLALRWCVENYVPAHQPSVARSALRVGYRDLCAGDAGWRRLSGHLVDRGLARSGALGADGVLRGLRGPEPARPGPGAAARLDEAARRRVLDTVERFGLLGLADGSPPDQ